MGLTRQLNDFPGKKTFAKIYNSIPGSPIVKNIIAGAIAVGAVVVGGIAVAAGGSALIAGAVALGGAFSAFLGAGLLVKLGVLAAIAGLWFGIRTAVGAAYTFDWNISDKAIEEQVKAAQSAFYRPLGEATGKLLGWVGCGFAPAAFTFAFSPAAFLLVTQGMREEAKEELLQAASQVAAVTLQSQARVKVLKFYGSLRKKIKQPSHPLHGLAKQILGEKTLKAWGEKDNESFVISTKIDEKIEKIKDKDTQALLEGFKEGFESGCQEASLSFATGMSEYIAATKLAANTSASGIVEVVV